MAVATLARTEESRAYLKVYFGVYFRKSGFVFFKGLFGCVLSASSIKVVRFIFSPQKILKEPANDSAIMSGIWEANRSATRPIDIRRVMFRRLVCFMTFKDNHL